MMEIHRNNLQNFCRTCLGQLQSDASNYHIGQTPNLAKYLLNIKGDEDAVYPQWICKKCYDLLQNFHHFREMSLRSADMLKKIVNDSNGQTASDGYFHDSEYTANRDVKIEVETTHILDDYGVNEKANNFDELILDSDLTAPSTSAAKKRKKSNDIDGKFECRILDCNEKFKSNSTLEAHLKLEHVLGMTEQRTVFNEHDETCISVDIHDPKVFGVECSKCQSINDFHNNRTDLKTFLKSSFEGILIQSHFDKHKKLDDAMQNNLTQLVISRELLTIVQNQKVTLENPIKKLEISSTILKNLAQEIAENFNERPGIYYTPGIYEGKKKVNPAGKFVQRINYMRRLMVENGLYRKPYK